MGDRVRIRVMYQNGLRAGIRNRIRDMTGTGIGNYTLIGNCRINEIINPLILSFNISIVLRSTIYFG